MNRSERCICVLCSFFFFCLLCGCQKSGSEFVLQEYNTDDVITQEASDTTEDTGSEVSDIEIQTVTEAVTTDIYVFVCGCVQDPGVYILPAGSRICDVIALAGGLAENADVNAVNQADLLSDGQKVYIPAQGEEYTEPDAAATGAGDTAGLIAINTAGKEELMTLPGIGENKADAILAYRQEHGGFQNKEELMNIDGIKEGVFRKIEPLISVDTR